MKKTKLEEMWEHIASVRVSLSKASEAAGEYNDAVQDAVTALEHALGLPESGGDAVSRIRRLTHYVRKAAR